MSQLALDPILDRPRLDTLRERVMSSLSTGRWMTLSELKLECGCSEAGISARLRELRKRGNIIARKHRENAPRGVWEYRLEGIA